MTKLMDLVPDEATPEPPDWAVRAGERAGVELSKLDHSTSRDEMNTAACRIFNALFKELPKDWEPLQRDWKMFCVGNVLAQCGVKYQESEVK